MSGSYCEFQRGQIFQGSGGPHITGVQISCDSSPAFACMLHFDLVSMLFGTSIPQHFSENVFTLVCSKIDMEMKKDEFLQVLCKLARLQTTTSTHAHNIS